MHWIWQVFLIIVVLFVTLYLGVKLYLYLFLKKMEKINEEIITILKGGLLEKFQNHSPYEEVKDEFQKLLSLQESFKEYVHFLSLRDEKEFDRKTDCLIVQYLKENDKNIARLHFRAFPIRTLLEKMNRKQVLLDAFMIIETLFKERSDLDVIELITHNQILNESIVKKMIVLKKLPVVCHVDYDYGVDYFPWVYAEWLMIHGKEDLPSNVIYEQMHNINRPIYIRLERSYSSEVNK